jgi:hypothetical protein
VCETEMHIDREIIIIIIIIIVIIRNGVAS